VCAGKGKGFLYRGGQKIAVVDEANLLDALRREISAESKK
jgi:hypothetical protein